MRTPADTAAALAAVEIIQEEPERRVQLYNNISILKQLIQQQLSHLQLLPSNSAILCIPLPTATAAVTVGEKLKAAGIFAPGIRPPTVPTSRIRISVMATHEVLHLQKLVGALNGIDCI